MIEKRSPYIRYLNEINRTNSFEVGNKGGSLGEVMSMGIDCPEGFVLTTRAFDFFFEKNKLHGPISQLLELIDYDDLQTISVNSQKIKNLIENSPMPVELEEEIRMAYGKLDSINDSLKIAKGDAHEILRRSVEPIFVAVRSSLAGAHKEGTSFTGVFDSYLNIKGFGEVYRAIKQCFSSLYSERSLYYLHLYGFKIDSLSVPVIVQKMIYSDKAGTIISNDILKKNYMIIESIWGLGEGIASGYITPDYFEIERNQDNEIIKTSEISDKKFAVARDSSGKNTFVRLTEKRSNQASLTNKEIESLAKLTRKIEERFGGRVVVEFAITDSDIYITDARLWTEENEEKIETKYQGELLAKGRGVSGGIGIGNVKIVRSHNEIDNLTNGDIFVCPVVGVDVIVLIPKIRGIISENGGISSTLAQLCKEMKVPFITGVDKATTILENGKKVFIDGDKGIIYNYIEEEITKELKNETIGVEEVNEIRDEINQKEETQSPNENPEEKVEVDELDNAQYMPGGEEIKSDIPQLNDAIPVMSEHIEEIKVEEIVTQEINQEEKVEEIVTQEINQEVKVEEIVTQEINQEVKEEKPLEQQEVKEEKPLEQQEVKEEKPLEEQKEKVLDIF